MACRINNHHTTSRFLVLIILALLLAHPCNSALWTNRSTPGDRGGGSSSLQVPARCRPEHAAALLQLKRSSFIFTVVPDGCVYNWDNTTLSSWIEGTDCCRWEGVACDRVSGSVTGLDLSGRSLGVNGSGLHPALFSLTSLKHLVLHGNRFCGSQLPASGFERLTHLEDLSLDSCSISGPIPPSFAGLHSLKTINLRGNYFSGSTFPLGITHLKQLKVLDFEDMGLYGPIPSSIGNLSLLTELRLSGNNFSGGLPSSLSNLTYLSRLECSDSGLSGRVPSLQNLSRLEFLDFSYNNFEGNTPLSDGTVLPNLRSVYMSHNSFTGAIQASIFTRPALQHLDLSCNHLSGHIEEFQNPSASLKEIYLVDNNLSGVIPSSFSQFRALTIIDLSRNNFTGTLDLYPYLMLQNLSSFVASHNPLLSVPGYDREASNYSSSIETLDLASCGLTRVPSVIKYLSELDYLDLSNNRIGGNIPDWIWRNMSSLSLQQNLFTKVGQLPAYLSIGSMNLSSNKLRGFVPFPFEAGKLDYSNNKFSSIRSVDFDRLYKTAEEIYLANNTLRGPIPYAECHHDDYAAVIKLDLSGNKLSGPLPPYLLKQGNGCGGDSLVFLNLRGNHLNGTWPDEMGESCSLQVVDLHGNQIQGRLPRSLASCNSLRHLDVGGNKFVDVFPSWLGNLPNLWLLVLRSNQFYGPLTMPGGNNHSVKNSYFSSLQIVDLAGNRFNGALPLEFFNGLKSMVRPKMDPDNILIDKGDYSDSGEDSGDYMGDYPDSGADLRDHSDSATYPKGPSDSLPRAKVQVSMKQLYLTLNEIIYDLVLIDLSENGFSGSIPKTIGNLTALHILNLSHNALSGNIPAEFGRLSKVESLDLSWNHLTGSIPPAMASLTNLEVLNLSYNDLSGRIPTGRQFSTFPSSSFQGGNKGLYGCQLSIRCNNLRQLAPAASTPAPPALATATHQSFEDVILWLFVGSGYGIGIAVSIVLQMTCCARHMNNALEKIASCIA